MSAEGLVRDYQRREQEYLKAKGITPTQLMQSPEYAEAYALGVARRLAGKKPVLNVLAEHGISLDEFQARVNKHGGDFATAVEAVVAEIERDN
jgi:hypothetical protein